MRNLKSEVNIIGVAFPLRVLWFLRYTFIGIHVSETTVTRILEDYLQYYSICGKHQSVEFTKLNRVINGLVPLFEPLCLQVFSDFYVYIFLIMDALLLNSSSKYTDGNKIDILKP
jgi:hypothetical protein